MTNQSIATSLLASLLIVPLAVSPALAEVSGFTADERHALRHFELVRRELSHRDGSHLLYGGTSWQRVGAPIEDVWRTAQDVGALTDLIPSLDEARVVSDEGDDRIVYLHHSYAIAETSYYVRMHFDGATHTLRFELDPSRPHDIHAGRGHLRLTPYRGGTIVEWGMLVDPGGGLINQIFGPMLPMWLLLPPQCMRDVVEPGRSPSC